MRRLRNLVLFIGILITTGMVFFGLSLVNLLLLVPWDTAIVRPDIGTWQRTLNDFFEGRTGETVMFIAMALVSIVPIVRTLRRRWDSALRVIVANLLLIFSFYIVLPGVFILRNALFPFTGSTTVFDDDPFAYSRYTNSILPLIAIWTLYAVWFREIASLAKHRIQRKSKAKNSDYHEASHRLSDDVSNENDSDYYHQALATKQQSKSQ